MSSIIFFHTWLTFSEKLNPRMFNINALIYPFICLCRSRDRTKKEEQFYLTRVIVIEHTHTYIHTGGEGLSTEAFHSRLFSYVNRTSAGELAAECHGIRQDMTWVALLWFVERVDAEEIERWTTRTVRIRNKWISFVGDDWRVADRWQKSAT